MITCLAKALSQIADALPRVTLSAILYPTEKMKAAVEELYAHLLRFFIRADDWYREGSLRHILHAVTRPAELRYKDLIEKIAECSRTIDNLALSGSQAELRDMHKKLDKALSKLERSDAVHSVLMEMRSTMICLSRTSTSLSSNANGNSIPIYKFERSIGHQPTSYGPAVFPNNGVLVQRSPLGSE